MPWSVAVGVNRVLRPGGLAFMATCAAWPPHDRPSDFWRFSADGLRVLFSVSAGFEVLEAVESLPCRIVPLSFERSLRGVERHQAFLASAVLARKVSEPDPGLRWDPERSHTPRVHYPA